MMSIRKIADRVGQLSGWRRHLLACAAGVLLTSALPPVYYFPALFPAFMLLFRLMESSRTKKQAFAAGWWFGFGHHVAGLYWISISLLVEPDKFAWMIPFAVSAIPAICAIYTGLVTLAVWHLPLRGWRRVILLAGIWVLAEIARAHLFTGFPWNLTGYIWSFSDSMIQFASVAGIYGLSFLAVLAGTIPILLASGKWRPVCTVFLAVLCIGAGGAWRISHAPHDMVPGIKLRLVQGNIPQSDKWDYATRMANLQRYMELTRGGGFDSVTDVIWPESAIPYILDQHALVLTQLRKAAPPHGLLLAGAVRQSQNETSVDNYPALWNSLFAIDAQGGIRGIYDKTHLVPFGEFIPFNKVLPLQKITYGMLDFTPGQGPVTLSLPPLPPFSPLICYEAIFPDSVVGPGERPRWILNITNDAWFGVSSGPYQHLQSARLRAVEQGIPLMRAANTGISAAVDAYGRIIAALPLNHEGVLDVELPVPASQPTLYSMFGTSGTALLLLLGMAVLFINKKPNF